VEQLFVLHLELDLVNLQLVCAPDRIRRGRDGRGFVSLRDSLFGSTSQVGWSRESGVPLRRRHVVSLRDGASTSAMVGIAVNVITTPSMWLSLVR
jgi:hypothetical protein